MITSSWWFQPICKILVRLDHFPKKMFETTTQTWIFCPLDTLWVMNLESLHAKFYPNQTRGSVWR